MAYDSDAQAWFTRVGATGTALSTAWQDAGNQLILDLKAASLFSVLTGLYLFNVEVAGQEVVNAVSSSNALTKHGTTTLAAKTGVTGDGSTGYYDTGFLITTSNMNSLAHGAICLTNGSFRSMSGVSGDSFVITNIAYNSGAGGAIWRVATGNSPTYATTSTTVGHFAGSRNVGSMTLYKDGVNQGVTGVSAHSPSGSQTFLLLADNGNFCDSQIAVQWFADSVLTDADMAALDTALKTFVAAVTNGPFDPSQLSGLVSWYDAQDASTITQSAGLVSQWNDKSPSALDVSQSTSANMPIYSATSYGGLPGITFSSFGTKVLTASTPPLTSFTDFTAYIVINFASFGFSWIYNIQDATDAFLMFNTESGGKWEIYSDKRSPNPVRATTALSAATPYQLGFFRSAAALESFRVNGVADSHTATSSPTIVTGTPVVLNIGNSTSGSNGLNGTIGEIIVYDRLLNSTEIGQVETYLSAKWTPPPVPVGTINGVATVSAVGLALRIGAGSAAGSGAASGGGLSTAKSAGSPSGIGTVSGKGQTIRQRAGTASGHSTVSAVGLGVTISQGAINGAATVTAPGTGVKKSAGSTSGHATLSADGQAVTISQSAINGIATVAGPASSTATSVGVIAGQSATTATGKSTSIAAGEADGSSNIEGLGSAQAIGIGTAAGQSEAEATGIAFRVGVGVSHGQGIAAAVGEEAIIADGSAAGTATVVAFGQGIRVATERMTRTAPARVRMLTAPARRRMA